MGAASVGPEFPGGSYQAWRDQLRALRATKRDRPPRAPDLTDEAVQAAARQARQQIGRNRAATFLSTTGSGPKSTILGGGK